MMNGAMKRGQADPPLGAPEKGVPGRRSAFRKTSGVALSLVFILSFLILLYQEKRDGWERDVGFIDSITENLQKG